ERNVSNTGRLVVALLLSVIVLVGSGFLMRKLGFRGPAKGAPAEGEQAEGSAEKETAGEAAAGAPAAQKEKVPAAPRQAIKKERAKAPKTTKKKKGAIIETELYEVEFSPHGTITRWELKKFSERAVKGKSTGGFVDLASGTDTSSMDYAYEVSPLKGENGVSLRAEAQGLKVSKQMVFEENGYRATLRYKITNTLPIPMDVPLFRWGPGIAETTDIRMVLFTSCVGTKAKRYKARKVKGTIDLGNVLWSGIGGKYFALAIIPGGSGQKLLIEKSGKGALLKTMVKGVAPGTTISGDMEIYAGPKDLDKLKEEGKNLELLINFGVFGGIGKVIFWLLKKLYGLTKNYGLAIIIISVIIKVILFPLSRKGLKS
ncbi:unnamed protein product, partial [marine sediment metagenome]